MPELSFGSHMFQDLVEADIFYGAIFGDEKTLQFHPKLFEDCEELFESICPDRAHLKNMIKVYDLGDKKIKLWVDAPGNRAVCGQKE